MKTLKRISILLIFSLAIFAGEEKDCFAAFFHAHKQIDCTANEASSGNLVIAHIDHADEVVSIIPDLFSFNSNESLSKKILKSESFFPQNNCTRIWQPPKLA